MAVDQAVDDEAMATALAAFRRLDHDSQQIRLAERTICRSMEWRAPDHHV